MKTETKIKLAQSSAGRIILHALCIKRDKKFWWHIRGIIREIF